MTTRTRRLLATLSSGIAAVALTLSVPGTAQAEHRGHSRHYDHGHHGKHKHKGKHHHHRQSYRTYHQYRTYYYQPYPVHVHGAYCGHRQSYGYGYGPAAHADAFLCQPCGDHFDHLNALHYHVHHSHGVPLWRLPQVVIHASMGWVFGG